MEGFQHAREGIELVHGDSAYPSCINDMERPPSKLYVRGNPSALSGNLVAIVGTRRPTPYGKAATELAARVAVRMGIGVASGGAIGCDQIAGIETLSRGGTHVIVLGCGADVVYPRSSEVLIRQTIEDGGAVVSMEPWGTQPRRYSFPKRNRLIAALSRATCVAEAGMPSGTFSTAEAASAMGREVLAIPGSIFSALSCGTNYLIGVGASCIANEEELECAFSRIFGTLRTCIASEPVPLGETLREREVMRALMASALTVNEVSTMLGIGAREALELVGSLLVQGLVEQQADGRYAASPAALHAQTSFGHNIEVTENMKASRSGGQVI